MLSETGSTQSARGASEVDPRPDATTSEPAVGAEGPGIVTALEVSIDAETPLLPSSFMVSVSESRGGGIPPVSSFFSLNTRMRRSWLGLEYVCVPAHRQPTPEIQLTHFFIGQ